MTDDKTTGDPQDNRERVPAGESEAPPASGDSGTSDTPLPADSAASAETAPNIPPPPRSESVPSSAVAAAAPPRSSAAPIAWLALLLILALIGAATWLLFEGQQRESELLQRVRALEADTGQDLTTFDQMRDNLLRKIELETEALQARHQRALEDQERALARQQQAIEEQQVLIVRQDQALAELQSATTELAQRSRQQLESGLQELSTRLAQQEQLVSELSVEDRSGWVLAEVRYLLRLANQRLIMTGDSASAQAMLRSADTLLGELDDADLHGLRAALAGDLAALQAVPSLDTQGLYLRIEALVGETGNLVMFELPERESPAPMDMADNWRARLKQGFQAALGKLSEYVVVNRRDVPVETLMDPQYEGLVRQNMRMLLEQAQLALLSGKQRLYEQSLRQALGWVKQFYRNDEQAAGAMSRELEELAAERVAVELPDLDRSLMALEAVLRERPGPGGA